MLIFNSLFLQFKSKVQQFSQPLTYNAACEGVGRVQGDKLPQGSPW